MIQGEPGFAVVLLTQSVHNGRVETSVDICAVTENERDAHDVLYDLAPYMPPDLLEAYVCETILIDQDTYPWLTPSR